MTLYFLYFYPILWFSMLLCLSVCLSVCLSAFLPPSFSPSIPPSLPVPLLCIQVVFDTATGIFESLAVCGTQSSDAIIKVRCAM
jgi:hypothetical protein